MRFCPDCNLQKSESDFGRASPRCRACAVIRKRKRDRQANIEFKARNPGIQRKYNKTFYAKFRDREKARAQSWRLQNKGRTKAVAKAWREKNKERFAAMKLAWRERNKEYLLKYRREFYARNKEYINVKCRAYKEANREELNKEVAQWYRDHPEVNRANRALRRAREKRAMPSWANKEKMAAIYAEAVRLTRETGIVYHVDHIYPLQSDWVCGLHCETNLQILTAAENQSKSNRPFKMAA
jgi:hypothetical protein